MKTCHTPGPLTRVRYFNGRLLSSDDLTAEQEYLREKHRLHNRVLHGWGVAIGLEVAADDARIRVAPGLALDCRGEEIVVCEAVDVPVPSTGRLAYVSVRYAEREIEPVPPPGGHEGMLQNSRIEESFDIVIEPEDPCREHDRADRRRRPCGRSHAISLALIRSRRGRWRVDRPFRRRRLAHPPSG